VPTRLSQAKMNSGFSLGEYGLLKLSYCDLRNTVRLAPAHQWPLGIIKKYMWGGFFNSLSLVAGVQWFRRCDERKNVRRSCCLQLRTAVPINACVDSIIVSVNVLILMVLHFLC